MAVFLLTVAISACLVITNTEQASAPLAALDKVLLNYERRDPPKPDSTTEVKLGLFIKNVEVNDADESCTVSMYMRQTWTDPRLFNISKETIRAEPKSFWLPDTFISNEQQLSPINAATSDKKLVRIEPNGDILYVQGLSVKIRRQMGLPSYPFTKTTCNLVFESFGYTTKVISFKPVTEDAGIHVADDCNCGAMVHSISDCTHHFKTDTYPCLKISLILDRNIDYFIRKVFVPSIVMLILACFSFWLRPTLRCYVCLLTVLVAIASALTLSVRLPSMPTSPRATALDVWTGFVVLFTVATFIEFLVVDKLHPVTEEEGKPASGQRRVDKICGIVFPVIAVIVVILYFISYCATS